MQVLRTLRCVLHNPKNMIIRNVCRRLAFPEESQYWKQTPCKIHFFISNQHRLFSNLSVVCWKCGESNKSVIFCEKCNALQNPSNNLNYFNLFGLDPSYDVEISYLSKQYRKLQSVLHPDKFSNSSENERKISEEYSAIINKAYTTLQQPLARGLYLLELQGIHLEEGNVQSNPEFLMELMERNEEVDEAKSDKDIINVSEKNKMMLDEFIKKVSSAFRAGNLKEAEEILIKMKYFSSIEAKIKVLKINKGFVE